jgi:hypothetical protein
MIQRNSSPAFTNFGVAHPLQPISLYQTLKHLLAQGQNARPAHVQPSFGVI